VLLGIFFRFLYIPIYIRMEVMNVPQSRSRISLAPSMVKGRGTKKGMMRKTARKAYEGEGIFDVVKSVGKAVAPTLIDLASQEAKRRVSGQGIFDVVKSVGSAVAPTLIDLASDLFTKSIKSQNLEMAMKVADQLIVSGNKLGQYAIHQSHL
jgi:enolase